MSGELKQAVDNFPKRKLKDAFLYELNLIDRTMRDSLLAYC